MEKPSFKFSEVDYFDLDKQPAIFWVTLVAMALIFSVSIWVGFKLANSAIQESVIQVKWMYGVGAVLCFLYIPLNGLLIIPQFLIRAKSITKDGVIFKKHGLHRFDDAKTIFISIPYFRIVFKNGRTFSINPNDARLFPALHLVLDYVEGSRRRTEIVQFIQERLKKNQFQGAWFVVALGLIGIGLSFVFVVVSRAFLIGVMFLAVVFGVYRLRREPPDFESHLAAYKKQVQSSRQ